MIPWQVVDEVLAPDGARLALARRGDEWEIRADGYVLMSSRAHGSEEALVRLALAGRPAAARVLLGGLGLGYSLRAVLDRLSLAGHVVVAEMSPAILEWSRGPVAALASRPIEDARVQVVLGDVRACIGEAKETYDAILLDVDNGPAAFVHAGNARLYDVGGIRACRGALRPGGVLAVWSAGPDEAYLRRLTQAGFTAAAHAVAARARGRKKHVVFVGVKRAVRLSSR